MLFDTTFLIDIERETKHNRQGPARSILRQHPNSPLFISVISVGEFAEGFESGREQDRWACLELYTVLTFDREIAWRTGQLSRQLRAEGQLIGDNDLWIAATAICHSLDLVTNNTNHFQRIPGLSMVTVLSSNLETVNIRASNGFAADPFLFLDEAGKENEVAAMEQTAHGSRYIVDGPLAAPDGSLLNIRSAWYIDLRGDGDPRFVTAHRLPRL